MKVLFASAVVASLLFASAAAPAADFQQGVNVTATAFAGCAANGAVTSAWALQEFTGPDLKIKSVPSLVRVATLTCNQTANVRVTSANRALRHTATLSCNGTANAGCVNYVADANWNNGSVNTAAHLDTATSNTAYQAGSGNSGTGDVTLTLTPTAQVNPVNAGTFQDTVTVAVGPGV